MTETQQTRDEKHYDVAAIEGLLKSYAGLPQHFENFVRSLIANKVTNSSDLKDLARRNGKVKLAGLAVVIQPYEQRDRESFRKALGVCAGYVRSIKGLKARMTPEEVIRNNNKAMASAMVEASELF